MLEQPAIGVAGTIHIGQIATGTVNRKKGYERKSQHDKPDDQIAFDVLVKIHLQFEYFFFENATAFFVILEEVKTGTGW